jgi:hypothetical protein
MALHEHHPPDLETSRGRCRSEEGEMEDDLIRKLRESNAELEAASRMLEATRREVEARSAEASRLFAETMRACEALIARLEGKGGV